MADALKSKFNLDSVELISGGRGEFTVWLDEQVIAKKDYNGFPTNEDAVEDMTKALAKRG